MLIVNIRLAYFEKGHKLLEVTQQVAGDHSKSSKIVLLRRTLNAGITG